MQKIIAMDAPSKPRHVVATVRGTTITVTWKAPKTDGGSPIVEHYVLADADGGLNSSCSQPTPGTARSCTITGVVPGASYLVTLTASNFVEPTRIAIPA